MIIIIANQKRRRSGAATVEAAAVIPVFILIILGMIIGSAGVFSNTQVAMLAREGARYAAVHGPTYASETGQPQATWSTVQTNAVLPLAAGLYSGGISGSLTWSPNTANASTVTVRVNYQWSPLLYFPAMQLSSTSTLPVTY
jgi:Flp pilus assembly protein TadG